MIKHFMAATVLLGCSLTASAAYAGSPYYADPGVSPRPHATHALQTGHVGGAWANDGYAATANDDAFGTQSAPAARVSAPTIAAPTASIVQAVPQYFYHAEGTMGAH